MYFSCTGVSLHHRRCPGDAGGGAGVGGFGLVVPDAVDNDRDAQVLGQRVGVRPHVHCALVLDGDAHARQVAVAVLLVAFSAHVEGRGVGDLLDRVAPRRQYAVGELREIRPVASVDGVPGEVAVGNLGMVQIVGIVRVERENAGGVRIVDRAGGARIQQALHDRFRRILERGDESFEAVVRVGAQGNSRHNGAAVGVWMRVVWRSMQADRPSLITAALYCAALGGGHCVSGVDEMNRVMAVARRFDGRPP